MSAQGNAGAMPQGISRSRVKFASRMIEIALDWEAIQLLAHEAL